MEIVSRDESKVDFMYAGHKRRREQKGLSLRISSCSVRVLRHVRVPRSNMSRNVALKVMAFSLNRAIACRPREFSRRPPPANIRTAELT
jgi:hypothetical protein